MLLSEDRAADASERLLAAIPCGMVCDMEDLEMSEAEESAFTCSCRAAVSVDINDHASPVICPECGADYGTWGEVKAEVMKLAAAEVKKDLKL